MRTGIKRESREGWWGDWKVNGRGACVRTSSSISEISDWRYSSIVRWKASLSLRFTGTGLVGLC